GSAVLAAPDVGPLSLDLGHFPLVLLLGEGRRFGLAEIIRVEAQPRKVNLEPVLPVVPGYGMQAVWPSPTVEHPSFDEPMQAASFHSEPHLRIDSEVAGRVRKNFMTRARVVSSR